MNRCFENLNKVEFVITYDCTGQCKHCSEGDHKFTGIHIKGDAAAKVVSDLSRKYHIKTVMTFGGEPLLYPESVYEIHAAAKKAGIPKRQLITNGYFSKNAEVIKAVADKLKNCGVNDILLSVDAFHQETIPLDSVKTFALEIKKREIPIRLNPAWLVSRDDLNPYNIRTREIIREFTGAGIPESEGNIVFPEGNAAKYLSDYFDKNKEYKNPYEENPEDIKTVSIEPDGKVFGGNIYKENVLEVMCGGS